MSFRKNIGKNDLENIYMQQFTLISKSADYHSVINSAPAKDFVYNKKNTKLHLLWISWAREIEKSEADFFPLGQNFS